MIIISLLIIGIISSIINKEFIEKHIVTKLDPDDENF
jgi:hypothetical protein